MMYDFTDLIRRHSKAFKLITHVGGEYVGGKWQNDSESVSERIGAILPVSERKIYHSGGSYAKGDKMLYMSTPINGPLENKQVEHKGNRYSVEEVKDFSDYSAVYVYVLRGVNRFD